MQRVRKSLGIVLVAAGLGSAAAEPTPQAAPAPQTAPAPQAGQAPADRPLIEGGPTPDVILMYTGDVIGYLDPCG
jgi:hypothetical protein